MFALRIIGAVFQETIGDLLYFPIWWYTSGLLRALKGAGRSIRDRARALGLRVWLANMFRPMYGQRDWQGYMISLVFRVLVLAYRSFVLCIWILGAGIFFIVYCALPLIAVYGLALSF